MNSVCHRANEESPDELAAVADHSSLLVESKINLLLFRVIVWLDENPVETTPQRNWKLRISNAHSLLRHQEKLLGVARPGNESPVMLLLAKTGGAHVHLGGRKLAA